MIGLQLRAKASKAALWSSLVQPLSDDQLTVSSCVLGILNDSNDSGPMLTPLTGSAVDPRRLPGVTRLALRSAIFAVLLLFSSPRLVTSMPSRFIDCAWTLAVPANSRTTTHATRTI